MASFDPRALLDPKGRAKEKSKKRTVNYGPQQSRKPSTNEGGNSKMSAAPPSQIGLESVPSLQAATSFAPSPPASGRNHLQNTNNQNELAFDHQEQVDGSPGMQSFFDRQYNLSNREAPPAKRRKVEAAEDGDEADDKPKSTFTGANSNGELGQHMKEEREKAAKSGPVTQAIDLTNDDDDDDDVQITGSAIRDSRDNEQVCLGMLHSRALVYRIPRYSLAKRNTLGTGFYPQMRVNYKQHPDANNKIELFDRPAAGEKNATKFANLELKAAAAIGSFLRLQAHNHIEISIYLDAAKRQPGENEGQAGHSRAMPVRILLFVPRGKVDQFGNILKEQSLWLATPTGVPTKRGIEVVNPHLPGYGLKPQSAAKGFQNAQPAYGVVRTQEDMVRETSSMFDNLVKSNEIPEMEADTAAIKTELQGLQKQALHFLAQHERERMNDDDKPQISLWKPRETVKGTVWANVITNHELPKQPEPVRGGILADVMGLGKTLSILALHASTRAEAMEFGEEEAPMEMEDVRRNAKATLVVCPKSVMTNWTQQIKEHTNGRFFKTYQYHGSDRTQDLDELASFDIVLVPYGTVSSEFAYKNGTRNALSSINWFRVVLDEAHQIRTPSTQVSKACCALMAQRRWAVTGTPVQNRLDDLGTLIKFLRIKPFDDEISWNKHIMSPFKMADEHVLHHLQLLVASTTLRRTKERAGLPDRKERKVELQFSSEERAMYAQFSGQANLQVRAMTRDKGRIQGKGYAFMLRSIHRLRAICAHGQEMLSEDDMKELEGLTAQTAIELGDEPDDQGEPDRTFITEGQAYDFLHMMVESESDMCSKCNKKIIKKEKVQAADAQSNESDEEESDEDDSDEEEDLDSEAEAKRDILGYINPCYDHLICPDCKDDYVQQAQEKQRPDGYHECPYCNQYIRFGLFELRRSALKSFLESKSPKNKKQRTKWDESTYSGPHTKVKALVNDLKETAKQSKMLPPGEPPYKSVIFSGWTTYMDLIEYALDEHSIRYTRLDGSMSIKQRSKVLDEFKSDDDLTVILVSIKAGGQGLNLTSANKVYMMEPQFNPGVEAQAIDRVHRIGQARVVEIQHYIMKDSIEEKIQKMQERKQELARLAMEKKLSKGEAAKKRAEELSELFK